MGITIWIWPLLIAGALFTGGCGMLNRVDRRHVFSRDGWSLPDRVVEALSLEPGMRIVDLGAGDGYFTFRLADAVGPTGRVYAAEIDESSLNRLRRRVEESRAENVTVVQASADTFPAPDGPVDLVFLSGVFHHIGDPVAYFARLHADLAAGGRIAIVDGTPDPLHKLILPFHFASAETVERTMREAGYQRVARFEFLPTMNFQIFRPAPKAS